MPKIEHVDLSCRVYETLKGMILCGELVPGQKIVQMKLAEQRLKSHLRKSRDVIAESLIADHRSAG